MFNTNDSYDTATHQKGLLASELPLGCGVSIMDVGFVAVRLSGWVIVTALDRTTGSATGRSGYFYVWCSFNFLIKWLTTVLCQRKQRVEIGRVKWEFTIVNAAVPQGTIFGPFGFIHHINDRQTVQRVHTWNTLTTVLYSTHTTHCTRHMTHSPVSTARSEQQQAKQWTAKNQMGLNDDKTKELRIYVKWYPAQRQTHRASLPGVTRTDDVKRQPRVYEITADAPQLYFIILLSRSRIPPHSQDLHNTSSISSGVCLRGVAHEPHQTSDETAHTPPPEN